MVNILCLGMGRQSTGLLLASLERKISVRYDYAIFSDLMTEPGYVYEYLRFLENYCWEKYGFEITVINTGTDILQDLKDFKNGKITRFDMIPAFVKKANGEVAKLRRQCTNAYKIQKIRSWISAKRNEARLIKKHTGHTEQWEKWNDVTLGFGIPLDEKERAAKVYQQDRPKYMTYDFPAITENGGLYTWDILKIFDELGIGRPGKSSCIFCPFHADAFWHEMKENRPDEFAVCKEIDSLIRNWPKLDGELYLHRSCKPIGEIDFMASVNTNQFFIPSGDCTSGVCGV